MRITDAVLARADVVLFFGRKGECNEPSLLFVMRYTPPTYSESAPSGAVELGLRQHPPTNFPYMKACQCRSSLGDLSRLGTNPDISNLYTTKNRKVTYLQA